MSSAEDRAREAAKTHAYGLCPHMEKEPNWQAAWCLVCAEEAFTQHARSEVRLVLGEAAKTSCRLCEMGLPAQHRRDYGWIHRPSSPEGVIRNCAANEIRALAAEHTKEDGE